MPPHEPSWPKVDTSDKELKIDRDKVKKHIKALEDDLRRYSSNHGGRGTPADVTQRGGSVTSQDVGGAGNSPSTSYPAGELIWGTIQKVNGRGGGASGQGGAGFPGAYGAFLQSYQKVINALYESAGILDKAEQDSTTQGNPNSGNTNDYGGNSQAS